MRSRFKGRTLEINALHAVWRERKSDFVFIRGRRRIGKSSLLHEATQLSPPPNARAFLFTGRADESDRNLKSRLIKEWTAFEPNSQLNRIRPSLVTWDVIFSEMAIVAREMPSMRLPLMVIFDEIQWIAKRQSGVLGALKEFWERNHHDINIKIILAGSSHRFFASEVDHSEGVLRGLRTRGDINLKPFTLKEVRDYFFPQWSQEEVALIYMMVGGVPYYLENIDHNSPFLKALNQAFLTADTIFLDEIDAMLRIETTGDGALLNVKKVMGALSYYGRTAAQIEIRTGLGGSSIHGILNRLESFGLIKSRAQTVGKKQNRSGTTYFMDDFYLNTYFTILEPMAQKIRSNRSERILIKEILQSKKGYYIPAMTGPGFELLLQHHLNLGAENLLLRGNNMLKSLGVGDAQINVSSFLDPGESQIDVVVTCNELRLVCVIEAKWKGSAVDQQEAKQIAEDIQKKTYPLRDQTMVRQNFVVLSNGATEGARSILEERHIKILTLNDLVS